MAETSGKSIPFEKHPLYEEAMQQIVAGDKQGAVATLTRLAEHYPDEQFLQDLLVRVQLQSTVGGGEYIPVDHSQGTPVLRTLVLVMLAVTTCLVVATGLIAVKANYIDPLNAAADLVAKIDALWDEVDKSFDAGDLVTVRELLEKLSRLTPDDPKIQESLAEVDRLKWCSDTYADAVAFYERGDWEAAEDRAYQIPPECPNYDDAQALIAKLKKLGSVETAWAEAQNLLAAEDCPGAITILTWIREEDPGFRRTEVEDLLFQCHVRVGQQILDGACGDLETVDQAAGHLKQALTLKPANQDLVSEYQRAVGYVAGHYAYDNGNWSVAVVRWEKLYLERPDYQCGALERKLSDSYPRAARQLISEANGSVRLLTPAVDYLEEALADDPGNEELLQEQEFAVEYLAGQEAFVQADWDLAIVHWGPIYSARPEYQNGALAENLRQACTQSTAPDVLYCKP